MLAEAILKPHKIIMKVDERLFKKFGRIYKKGSIIFREDDGGKEMFYVLTGRIHPENVDFQVKKVLAEIGPGQYFGEMAALIDISRSATARAVEDSHPAVIESSMFRSMMRENQDVAMHMLREFSRRLKNSNTALEELVNLPVRLIIIYFLENSDGIIVEHLPELTRLTGKHQAEIRELLNDPALRDVFIIRDGCLTELVGERIGMLLDAGASTKRAMEEIGEA